jgi:Resolvase, N terminal domain
VEEFYDEAERGQTLSRLGPASPPCEWRSNDDRRDTSRFARDLMVQGYAMLKERGIELSAADSSQSFIDDTPTARLVRQLLGAIAEFDKGIMVAKLRGARGRKRARGVKVEERKSHGRAEPGRRHGGDRERAVPGWPRELERRGPFRTLTPARTGR